MHSFRRLQSSRDAAHRAVHVQAALQQGAGVADTGVEAICGDAKGLGGLWGTHSRDHVGDGLLAGVDVKIVAITTL